MGKWCLHASSFIFDRIIIKVADNQDRHKSSDGFNFGPLVSMAHLYVFWNEIWPGHIGLRWAIVALWATCSAELWPLIDVRILFPFNIFRTNWWILMTFYVCSIVIFQLSYGPWLMSEFCFHLISSEQTDGFGYNFVYAVLWLSHKIFLNISTVFWPLIGVKISILRNNEWILIKFCSCNDIYDPCCD